MSSELTREEEDAKRDAEETIARLDSISIFPDDGGSDSNFNEKETRTKEDDEASSSSSDDDTNDDLEWDLGFLEAREDATALHAIYFPSKVGGDPQWLDPSVNPKQMHEANATKRRMDFLLQIYAANDDTEEDSLNTTNAFHRTIYVFTSVDGDKVFEKGKVRAVRSQLARANEFYGTTPAPRRGVRESDDLRVEEMIREFEMKKRAIETKVKMTLSGGNGSESKEEEEEMKTKTKNENENTVYPEFEIVVEPESDADEASCSSMDSEGVVADTNDDDDKKTSNANTNKKKMFQSIGDEAITETDLKEIASGVIDSDAQRLATFSVKLAKFPDQVLRYCPAQNAKAMWPSKSLAPDDRNIPDCPRCRGKRRFEFQILPTIVSFIVPKESVELNDSSLDFGSIAVYTCSKSCALEGEYAEEYVLVHPPMNS
ncbi:unnamed protein product [Bathycoccus prasinos]